MPDGQMGRILIIVQNLPVPFDRRVWLEATTLADAGYAVSVICPKLKGYNESYERLESVDIYRYPMPFDPSGRLGFVAETAWGFLRTLAKSFRVAWKGRGFDVIHACNPPETYWLLGLIWRIRGTKFIFDHHDLSPELYLVKFGGGRGLLYRSLLKLERASFAVADVAIATNQSYKSIAVERGGMAPDRVFVVRSAPALNRFRRYETDLEWKRGKQFLIAYLGEIAPQDGVDRLVEASRILRDEYRRNDFHAVVIGGGPHQSVVKAYADEIGVDDIFTFTGDVRDDDLLCRILSSADIGVDPVPRNAWSDKSTMNKIVEYMFFGLPVVAYDLTETRFSAQDAGAYASANAAADLARVLSELLDDPERRETMSKFAMRRLEEEMAWEHSIPALLEAYEMAFSDSAPK